MKWLILLLGIASNASASVLIKLAMQQGKPAHSWFNINTLIALWPLWLGIGLYGIAFVLYAAALARFPLNVAHPVLTSGAIATVALMSAVVFREPMHGHTLLGLGLIIAGVVCLSIKTI